jgi:hypothetical protein
MLRHLDWKPCPSLPHNIKTNIFYITDLHEFDAQMIFFQPKHFKHWILLTWLHVENWYILSSINIRSWTFAFTSKLYVKILKWFTVKNTVPKLLLSAIFIMNYNINIYLDKIKHTQIYIFLSPKFTQIQYIRQLY